MKHYGIAKHWSMAGFYETPRLKQLQDDIRVAIISGQLISITGPTGSGKTMLIQQLQGKIDTDKKIMIAQSLSVDKKRVTLPSLITALFLDLSGKLDVKIPKSESRERALLDLINKVGKPVVLFIDEAHVLHGHTLNGLKRLMEVLNVKKTIFSIVLVGQQKLKNDLKRPTMEEVGNRVVKFDFYGIGDDRHKFLDWILKQCLQKGTKKEKVITDEACEVLIQNLATPLQFNEHLTRSFTEAYRLGEPKVTKEIAEETISFGFQDLDAKLSRIGYTPKDLALQFDVKLPMIRAFLKGKLPPEKTDELSTEMRNAGLPI